MARKKEYVLLDLEGLDSTGLRKRLEDSQQELFSIRFQLATGSQTNSSQIRQVKRRISQIHTVLREKELGIKRGRAKSAKA